ncbi:hypothetical protein M5361_14385 [Ligilactobacillus agilis]|nr:hypothetical protein [Ligilactobacillus agilis]
MAEVATSSATASVGSDTASQASQTGKVLQTGAPMLIQLRRHRVIIIRKQLSKLLVRWQQR